MASGGQTHEAVVDFERHLLARRPSESSPARVSSDPGVDRPSFMARLLKAPGGFRRGFLHEQADADGTPMSHRPSAWKKSLMDNGLEVLSRYGAAHFREAGIGIGETGEHIPVQTAGDASKTATVFALLKSFVGSGITFMPGAFRNGGWVLSSISLAAIGLLNGLCISMLLECRHKQDASDYGEIAFEAMGTIGEKMVQTSLVLAQFGTCVAFIVFIIKNGVSLGLGTPYTLVGLQLIVLIPLCLIRPMEKLEIPNLIADVLIVAGLAAIVSFEASLFIKGEDAAGEMQVMTLNTVTLFFGASMQALEGIPTILPIRNAMREPESFPKVFTGVFTFIVCLYIFFALLGYASFGLAVDTPVLLNLPTEALWVKAMKVGYMLALVLSVPLMFIPVARITELWAFGIVRKKGSKKWSKNALRAVELLILATIAILGAESFEKVLGLIGGLCATPLAFVYPPLFHCMICAERKVTKCFDLAIAAFGLASMAFVVFQVIG